MATNFLWGAAGATINNLTTELNSLASGSGSAYGPEKGAAGGGASAYQMGMVALHIASNSLAFTTASYIKIFFVSSIDTASGSVYPTYTSGSSYKLAEPNYLCAILYINPATQSANVVDETLPYVPIPLGFYKTILVSQAGVTLPSSANTVNTIPTPTQY